MLYEIWHCPPPRGGLIFYSNRVSTVLWKLHSLVTLLSEPNDRLTGNRCRNPLLGQWNGLVATRRNMLRSVDLWIKRVREISRFFVAPHKELPKQNMTKSLFSTNISILVSYAKQRALVCVIPRPGRRVSSRNLCPILSRSSGGQFDWHKFWPENGPENGPENWPDIFFS